MAFAETRHRTAAVRDSLCRYSRAASAAHLRSIRPSRQTCPDFPFCRAVFLGNSPVGQSLGGKPRALLIGLMGHLTSNGRVRLLRSHNVDVIVLFPRGPRLLANTPSQRARGPEGAAMVCAKSYIDSTETACGDSVELISHASILQYLDYQFLPSCNSCT